MNKTKKSIITFLVLCFALSAPFYYLIVAQEILVLTYVLMWCPGVAALIVSLMYHRGENACNFRKCQLKHAMAGVWLPLVYWGISYGIYLLIYGKEVIIGNMPLQLIQMPGMLMLYLTIFFITAMGEEIGWRGFLVPKLNGLFGFKKGAFISGVVWALWHFPLFISGYMSDIEIGYQGPILILMCVSLAYPMFYLSIKSKSAWPGILLHFVHNFVAQLLLDQSIGGEMRPYLVGETGIISVSVFIIIAVICVWKYSKTVKEKVSPKIL